VQFGRPQRLNAKQKRMIAERRAAGSTIAALSRAFDVGQATVRHRRQIIDDLQ